MARLVTSQSLETDSVINALFQLKRALSDRAYQIHGNQPATLNLTEEEVFDDLAEVAKDWLVFQGYDLIIDDQPI